MATLIPSAFFNFQVLVPITWFIDEQGTVVYKHIGEVESTEELIDLTAKYLKVTI